MSDDLKGLPIHKERITEILHLASDVGEKMGLQAFYKILQPHQTITFNCEYFSKEANEWVPVETEHVGFRACAPYEPGVVVRQKLFESYGPELERQDIIIEDETL